MKRAWIGVAILSSTWILGLSYYYAASWLAWTIALALAIPFLTSAARTVPNRTIAWISAAMLLVMVLVAPWPYRAGPLLMALGLALQAIPIPQRWPQRLGSALMLAGVVLIAQSAAMLGYESFTARFPDLPGEMTRLLAGAMSLIGMDVAPNGGDLSVFTMRKVHRIGATWSLLLAPMSLCFIVGGIMLVLLGSGGKESDTPASIGRRLAKFTIPMLLWLPVRSLLMLSIYMHRTLRLGFDDSLSGLVDQFWSPWVSMALLAGPVLLAWRFASDRQLPGAEPAVSKPDASSQAWLGACIPAALAMIAVGILTFAVAFEPVGQRQQGRVLVVDYHDHQYWPSKTFDTVRTDQPFVTNIYGQAAAYNHSCLYDYCSRFYQMSRQVEPLHKAALQGIDVLVLKVPSVPYSPEEIKLVMDFVDRGGGLFLLGEHTSVYGSGPYLNVLAEKFGFRFRYDCAFGIDSVFEQRYVPPMLPHPIVQNMPEMEFATSCTIDPGSTGQAVIQASGLKNLGAYYHVANFYPQAKDQPEMRYGAFVQLLATRHGRGRVAAFSDSTIFSNFCAFEPGKSEIMLGILEWLNHRGGSRPTAFMAIAATLFLLAAIVLGRKQRASWMLILAAATLGWSFSAPFVKAINSNAMPAPKPHSPLIRIGLDRTICDSKLPKNGFISGRMTDFGQFERSILRLGYFTRRASGRELLDSKAIVFLKPNLSIPTKFKEQLKEYVEDGGRLLVMDSPDNGKSTGSQLLHEFGMMFRKPWRPLAGKLKVPPGWPAPTIKNSMEVVGGEPMAHLGTTAVAAKVKYGKGEVMAIGFATRFTDNEMGFVADVTPKGELIPVFEYVYAMMRAATEGTQPMPTTAPAPKTQPAPKTKPAPKTQPARR